jgi:glycosyltransferase involved in cell wall biosynthesis
MKLVSVVIPCYRQAHFLGEAIESVLSQSYRNFEIIVVDDGSPDNTFEVATRYPGVRYIRQDNRGQSGARNRGLQESKGNYLVFLDADDRLFPNALEIGMDCLDVHPECAFVFGHVKFIAQDGSPLLNLNKSRVSGDHYLNLLRHNYITTVGMVMFRRAIFDSAIGFDPSLAPAEDWDLYLRITKSFPVYDHGKVVVEYRIHTGNITSNNALLLKYCLAVISSQRDFIKGNKQYEGSYKFWIKGIQYYYGELNV